MGSQCQGRFGSSHAVEPTRSTLACPRTLVWTGNHHCIRDPWSTRLLGDCDVLLSVAGGAMVLRIRGTAALAFTITSIAVKRKNETLKTASWLNNHNAWTV
jgi:hypothetical protein